jgi:membrane protease YdiL (CAAX protease family)
VTETAQESAAGPAETYIGLARLGRLDAWSTVKAILRIVLYPVLFILLTSVAISLALAFAPDFAKRVMALYAKGGAVAELLLILITFLPLTWAVRDAVVKSQRRPFLSLIGPDLRFDWRRFALGAAIWLAAILAGALLGPLLPMPPEPAGSPSYNWSLLPAALVALLVIPIQAGTEELLCRGWLTQLLGQAVRNRIVVALLVAVFFSLLHGIGSWISFAYFMIASLAFSAISLRDGRLELTIGAHAMQNLFVLLVASPLEDAGHRPSLLDAHPAEMPWTELPLGIAIALIAYLLADWLVPRLIGRG